MKQGDTFPVRYNEHEVATMQVVEISEDKVYLEIPATRIVMSLQTSLSVPVAEPPSVDRLVTALPDNSGDTSSAAKDAIEPAKQPSEPSMFVDLPAPGAGGNDGNVGDGMRNLDSSALD